MKNQDTTRKLYLKGQTTSDEYTSQTCLLRHKQTENIAGNEAESADWSTENPKLREPFATSSRSTRGSSIVYSVKNISSTHLRYQLPHAALTMGKHKKEQGEPIQNATPQ